MKKLIPFIVAALILVLASPAFAANVKVTGSISSQTGYNNQDNASQAGLFSNSTVGLGAEAQLSENLKAVIGLKAGMGTLTGIQSTLQSGSGLNWNDFAMLVDKAYIESNGPLFAGMPSMITRLGTQEIGYSNLNAQAVMGQGIGFSGLGIGPVTLAGFQSWTKDKLFATDGTQVVDGTGAATYATGQARGVQVDVHALKGVDVTANVIDASNSVVNQLSGALETTVKPIDPLTIKAGAGYVYDGSQDVLNAMAIRGSADYQVMPALSVHAGARRVGAGYAPFYGERDKYNAVVLTSNVLGVNAGAAANVFGATLNTDIDRAMYLDTKVASYTGKLDVSRPVTVAGMNFVPKYAVTLKADEATMFSAMPTVASQDLSLTYNAPNNVNITGGVNLTDIKAPKPYVNASMDLSF